MSENANSTTKANVFLFLESNIPHFSKLKQAEQIAFFFSLKCSSLKNLGSLEDSVVEYSSKQASNLLSTYSS